MGSCLDKVVHKDCGHRTLQVFAEEDGTVKGYCFFPGCLCQVDNPYGEAVLAKDLPPPKEKMTQEELDDAIHEIQGCGAVDLPDRRLRAEVLDDFDVKIGVSTKDGKTPDIAFLPYTKRGVVVRYKARLLHKKVMWNVGGEKDVDLFGWERAIRSGAKRLVITEGEYDAIALQRILEIYTQAEYKDAVPAVVSLINGSGSAGKDLARLAPKIRKHFKEISLAFDNDEAGELAVEQACKSLPEATSISLPCKDANACLIEGKGKAAFKAVTFNASKPKNTRIVWLDEVWEDAKEQAEWGVSWPWPDVTEKTRGIRKGETIYVGAAQKMGKSEVVNALGAHLVGVHDWTILMAKPEEANKKTVKLLAGKIASARFHDPKVEFDEKAYDRAGKVLLGKKVAMLNLYQHLGWESLKQDIIAGAAEGIDAVFIDPITNLTNGMESSSANTKLQEIAQELSAMALDLDIVIFIFCHLRNPDAGAPHDRGGHVLTSQFAGSRAMGRSCNYMFGLEGNKDPELEEEERNIRHLVLLDDREYGEVGKTALFWNKETTQFAEMGGE